MGSEDEIRSFLQQGYAPQQLIAMKYKKSTVYKVYKSVQSFSNLVIKPPWTIQNIKFDNSDNRYLPGSTLILSFDFINMEARNIYLQNIGIQTEWMDKEFWVCQNVESIIKSKEKKPLLLRLTIPNDISLGEYTMRFGIEGQYLPVQSFQDQRITTNWSEPYILNIKYPLIGTKIFISHSVKDKYLIRELEALLDNYGMEVLIGEDKQQPGKNLDQKFKNMINSADLILAILTNNALQSYWFRTEVNYGYNIKKPLLLLKEESVKFDSEIEYVEFSQNMSPHHLLETIMHAISNLSQNTFKIPLWAILGAILGFIAGYYLAKSK